jgi:hypothetical protein
MNRRNFLGLLAGSVLGASTKKYFFFGGIHRPVENALRITIPKTGYYIISLKMNSHVELERLGQKFTSLKQDSKLVSYLKLGDCIKIQGKAGAVFFGGETSVAMEAVAKSLEG